MNLPADTAVSRLRRSTCWILAVAGVGIVLGRIFAVDSVDMLHVEKQRKEKLRQDLRSALKKQGLAPAEIAAQLKLREEEWQEKVRLRRPFLSANDRSRWCTVRALVEPEMRVEGAPYAIDKVVQEPLWDTIDMVKHGGRL